MHTRKIGTNKGKPRIWLEGKELTAFGIRHGMRWNVTVAPNTIVIEVDANGKRKIAGTPQRPIIDMTGRTVIGADFISDTISVTAGNRKGVIVLTGLPK